MVVKVTDTSLEAFKEVKEHLGERQAVVYHCLKEIQPATNLMISKKLSIPINSITPRMNELRNQLRLVGFAYKAKCPISGRSAFFWKCVR